LRGLGKVLAVVDLGIDFVTHDFIACNVVACAVLIDGIRHGVYFWIFRDVVQFQELTGMEGQHSVSLSVIIAKVNLVNIWRKDFDDCSNLTARK
jgi:hypothetical protein